jgi:hypothetical protein
LERVSIELLLVFRNLACSSRGWLSEALTWPNHDHRQLSGDSTMATAASHRVATANQCLERTGMRSASQCLGRVSIELLLVFGTVPGGSAPPSPVEGERSGESDLSLS